jgi:hypothetical protein
VKSPKKIKSINCPTRMNSRAIDEFLIIFLIAAKAEIKAVKRPILIIIKLLSSENCKIGEILTSINTPAVTIVAA